MDLTWLSVDLLTGRVLEELVDLDVSKVGVTIGTYTTTTARLPVPTAPPDWLRATTPWAAGLVLLADGEPLWGGPITQRRRPGDATVSLSLSSWEGYLDRRYIGDRSYTAVPQCTIVKSLVDQFALPSGIAMTTTIDGDPGQARDRTYRDDSDKSVLTTIQELSGVIGGPEWTIRTRHHTDPDRYIPELVIANRLGASPDQPAAFEFPGAVLAPAYTEDWSHGRGATSVVATSSAEGDQRPQSPPALAADPERPRLEYRWSPSSSITDIATLVTHAAGALAAMRGGATTYSLASAMQAAPRYGVDWTIGDDIAYRLEGPEYPDVAAGTARAIGWEATLTGLPTITPILAGDDT